MQQKPHQKNDLDSISLISPTPVNKTEHLISKPLDDSEIRPDNFRNSLLLSGLKPKLIPTSHPAAIIQRRKTTQTHHFLPIKFNEKNKILENLKISLGINAPWNKEEISNMWHCSKHPNQYNDCAEKGTKKAAEKMKPGNLKSFQDKFNEYIKKPVSDNPWYLQSNCGYHCRY